MANASIVQKLWSYTQEIVEDLRAALEQFEEVANDLARGPVSAAE